MRAVNITAKPPNHNPHIGCNITLLFPHFRSFLLNFLAISHLTMPPPSFPLDLCLLFSSYYRPASELFSELHHEIILPAIVSPLLPVSKCSQSANWNGELLIGIDPHGCAALAARLSLCLFDFSLLSVEANNRHNEGADITTKQQ